MTSTKMLIPPVVTRLVLSALVVFLAGEVAYHTWGVLQDSLAALQYTYRLDYGEGIVWEQALLMFGPRMYSPSPDLPFIVFHYPPLYHILVRGLLLFHLDPLFAGRLISGLASAASSIVIIALALISVPSRPNWRQCVLALIFGLLFLCLDPVRTWGIWMRVDLLAVCLGLVATLVAVQSRFSTIGTTVALLLSVAALFAKQNHLPAGLSIFAVGIVCARRQTIIASLIAGTVGLACVAMLELETHGFLKNIILYNINPIKWSLLGENLALERDNLPYMVCMCAAAVIVTVRLLNREQITRLRQRNASAIVLYLLAIHFWLAFISAFQIAKDGASTNYFLDFLGVGCALLAVAVGETTLKPARLAVFAAVIALTTSNIQYRRYSGERFAIWTAENDRLVREMQQSPKPIASDDLVMLLRAGKPIIFEPAIVRVLTATGTWNPSALLEMFHDKAFSMVITADPSGEEAGPVIAEAIASDYPVVKQGTPRLILHLPASAAQP